MEYKKDNSHQCKPSKDMEYRLADHSKMEAGADAEVRLNKIQKGSQK